MKGFRVFAWIHQLLAIFCLAMAGICWKSVQQGNLTLGFAIMAILAFLGLSGLLYWDSREFRNEVSD